MRVVEVSTMVAALAVAAVTTARGQRPAAAPITPQLVARGDSIFHGQAAGALCFGCHGPEGKGVPGVAPDLTAGKWLHGDGSYGFIMTIVEQGVPKPKVAAAPMPPMGGAQLTPADIRAVAAYVYSLTHAVKRSGP